jgi:sugar phosphate isomerase/epimerase
MKTSFRFLGFAALAAAAAPLAALADFHDHLGIQMWSLRETAKTDTLKALDLVKQYGLTEIETAGFGTLTQDQYVAAVKERGLKVVAAHVGYEELQKSVPDVIKAAKALGARFVVVPWIPHPKEGFTVEQARKVAADFNAWGETLREAGLQLGWHPHGFEFEKSASGQSPFEVIVTGTRPGNLVLEMDVFWVVHAGQDPFELLKKYGNRWALMHVKDMREGAETGLATGGAPATDNVPVGSGQIGWQWLLRLADQVGVKYYILEDETPNALESIPVSLKFLRGLKG